MNVYEIITDRITSLLSQGTIPWKKPWNCRDSSGKTILPQNLLSKKPYRGINHFLLTASGFSSPYWLSFKQVKELGGSIKAGEHGFPCIYWNWFEIEDENDPTKIKSKPFLRYYTVFNVNQTKGIPETKIPSYSLPDQGFNPIPQCEKIVAEMPNKPSISHKPYDRACYSPTWDSIALPPPENFHSREEYYGTLFHELGHSTGHISRLDRPGITESIHFGSAIYAKEELVAEMASAFLCGHSGIHEMTVENQTAYIADWLRKLQNDKKLVVIAAAQAQKAADYILNTKGVNKND